MTIPVFTHADADRAAGRGPPPRTFPPAIDWDKKRAKGTLEELSELRFSRAFAFCLQEARSNKKDGYSEVVRYQESGAGTGRSTIGPVEPFYNFETYGFKSPEDARNAQLTNPISIALNLFSDGSTSIPKINKRILDLAEKLYEDLKGWASGDQKVKKKGTGWLGLGVYSTDKREFIKIEFGSVDEPEWDKDERTLVIPSSESWLGPPGNESEILKSNLLTRSQAALIFALGWSEEMNVQRQVYRYDIYGPDGSKLLATVDINNNQSSGIAPLKGAVLSSISVTDDEIRLVRPLVMEASKRDRALRDAVDTLGGPLGVKPREFKRVKSRTRQPVIRTKKIESASIWDQQCFLIENIKRISSAAGARQYGNFGILDGAPGNIVSALHHGDEEDFSAMELLNLPPEVYALMVPYMKLYRVLYDKDNPLEVIGEQEMPFESFTSRDDIDNIYLSRESRQAGAGVKSFEWKLEGVQPEEVDNNITATLQVHFQSVYDLFRYNIDPSQGTDALQEAQAGLADPGFLDLIIAPETQSKILRDVSPESKTKAPGACDEASRIYEGALYRIKIVVGWSVPDGLENIPGELNAQGIREAIEKQRTTLFLQLARHNMDFQQDGTVKLTVEYQAALTGIMRSGFTDIFADEKALEDIFKSNQRARNLQEDYEKDGKSMSKHLKKELEKYHKQQLALEREDRLRKYRRVLKYLYRNGTINSIRVPMKELLLPNWRDLTPAQRAKRAKRRQSKSPKQAGFTINTAGSSSEHTSLYKLLDDNNPNNTLSNKNLNKIGRSLNSIKDATPSDHIDIHYLYLGDLLASILGIKHIKDHIDADAFQLVLGTVEIIDPLVAYQISNIDDITSCKSLRMPQSADLMKYVNPLANKSTNIVEHIDLSAVPISIDKFNEWFFNKIVRKNVTKYHLDQFIRDLLGSLVGRCLSARCFYDIPQVPVRFATSDFLVHGSLNDGRHNIVDVRKKVRSERVTFKKEGALPGPKAGSSVIPTLFVYSTDSLPQGNRSGDWNDDFKQGIYHFYLGSSAGLVKKISFNREDMAFLREARLQKQGSLGAQQLRELYSVKLTLIGNTLLKNGQFIFVNPSAIGAGSPNSTGTLPNLARLLGLGGYFLVTGVSHRIGENGFEVVAEALHQSISLNESPTIPIVPYSKLKAEKAPSEPDAPHRESAGSKRRREETRAERRARRAARREHKALLKRTKEAEDLARRTLGDPRFASGGEEGILRRGAPLTPEEHMLRRELQQKLEMAEAARLKAEAYAAEQPLGPEMPGEPSPHDAPPETYGPGH